MKSKLIAGLILAGGSMFAAPRVSVGFGFGSPVHEAPAYRQAYIPPCPGPDYVFVDGYWQQRRPVIFEHRERFERHEDFRRDFHRR